MDQIWCWIE